MLKSIARAGGALPLAVLTPFTPGNESIGTIRIRGYSTRIIALGILIALLYYGQLFFTTLITAVIVAFILEPFVLLIMRLRIPRGVASFLACSVALLGVYLLGLGVFTQVAELVDDLPAYSKRINDLFDRVSVQIESVQKTVSQLTPRRLQDPPPNSVAAQNQAARRRRPTDPPPPAPVPQVQEVRIQEPRASFLFWLYGWLQQLYNPILMFSFVPFLVYFMLAWRDHMRRVFHQLFDEGDQREMFSRSWNAVADMARAYTAGNFLLGLVLALASTLFFMWIGLPYPLLIGPMSGFLSLVPYVGLPMAMAPPVLAALAVFDNPWAYVVITSVVGFMHLIGLNLLYPKMVGGRVHLNPIAVTVALMFWGLLWGGIGLVLAIPITAGMKAVFDNVEGLRPFGRLLGD